MVDYKFSFQMISRKAIAGFFSYYTHTWHPSGGVDVPFVGYGLSPNFLPSILSQFLTLIDDKWQV